jgi:hypothetical protein
MKHALVIYTGINYSHYIADHAIDWALRNKTSLHVLFLRASREEEEGYGFPSDLDAAERLTTSRDAEEDDRKLLQDYQKILNDLGKEKKVQISTEVLLDPPFEHILTKTREAAIVFADATFDPADPLSPKQFSIEELKEKAHAPVEVLREPNS